MGQTTGRVRRSVAVGAALMVCVAAAAPPPAADSELRERTARAYQAYLEGAERAFVTRAARIMPAAGRAEDSVSAGPAHEDGIIKVPGGLIHHWSGTAFVPGRSLLDLVAVSRAYGDYPSIYRAVLTSNVLDDSGDTVRVQMRIKESAGGLSAVLEIRSTVRYSRPGPDRAVVLSSADEIREVKDAGARDERLLPAGRDSGYLWRANTFTRLVEVPGGVHVEMETLGLSRGFPPLLGWIIEPIARRIGRRSVEATLREFVAASLAPPAS